jgi:ubiquinone/menaquinone biosynthesis C-methylase UbiE
MIKWMRARRQRRVAVADEPDGVDYIFGEGEAEISRLNFQHYMFRLAFGSNFSAPLRSPRDILDVACGTGRLVRELSRQFPQSNVIGFDINPDQFNTLPAEGSDPLPDNCTLIFGNALEAFSFASGSFDFTVARACSSFIPVAQWPQVIGEMMRVTGRDGWVEIRDFGLVRSPNAALNELTAKFAHMSNARGIHPGAGPFLKQYIDLVGGRRSQIRQVMVRSGGPGRSSRAGQLLLADYLALMERVTPVVAQTGLDTSGHWVGLVRRARDETRFDPVRNYAEVELTAAYFQPR